MAKVRLSVSVSDSHLKHLRKVARAACPTSTVHSRRQMWGRAQRLKGNKR
jgi:hypothetical protein